MKRNSLHHKSKIKKAKVKPKVTQPHTQKTQALHKGIGKIDKSNDKSGLKVSKVFFITKLLSFHKSLKCDSFFSCDGGESGHGRPY